MSVFGEMGNYWAEIADQNATQEQINFIKATLKPQELILDLACGTGRHTIPLSKEDYGMVGVDLSLNLLHIAKSRGRGIQLVRGDMRFLPFKPEAFSAAISMDTSFGYLPTETDDAESLNEIRRVLRQGGMLIIDVFNCKRLMAKYLEKPQLPKWIKYPSFFLQQKRTISDNGYWLCDSWTVREKDTGQLRIFEHMVRLYEPDNLRTMVERAGFAVKQVFGSYKGQSFTLDSPRFILISEVQV